MGPLYFFTWRYKSDIDFLSVFKKLKFECFIEIFESIFKKIDSNYIKKWCKVFKFRRFRALHNIYFLFSLKFFGLLNIINDYFWKNLFVQKVLYIIFLFTLFVQVHCICTLNRRHILYNVQKKVKKKIGFFCTLCFFRKP